MQVFLTFCMLVTLYFAKEIPLEPKPAQHLSDSSPLLKDPEQYQHLSLQAKWEKLDNGHNSRINMMDDRASTDASVDFGHGSDRGQIEALDDGPTAVLVNILTSMRHLPPGMHSVLLVMALTWVCGLELTCLWLSFTFRVGL